MSKTPRTEAFKWQMIDKFGTGTFDEAFPLLTKLETELNEAHQAFVIATDQLVKTQSELRQVIEQKKNLFYALELIEEAFVDGDDTYKAWLEMGRIAKNALEQHQSENK